MQVIEHDQRSESQRWIDGSTDRAADHRAGAELVQGPDVGPVLDLTRQAHVARTVARDVQQLDAAVLPVRDAGRPERRLDVVHIGVIKAG